MLWQIFKFPDWIKLCRLININIIVWCKFPISFFKVNDGKFTRWFFREPAISMIWQERAAPCLSKNRSREVLFFIIITFRSTYLENIHYWDIEHDKWKFFNPFLLKIKALLIVGNLAEFFFFFYLNYLYFNLGIIRNLNNLGIIRNLGGLNFNW